MATYTIDIPVKLVPGLNRLVARFNAHNGSDLSVQDWLRAHTLEIALQDDLAAEQQRLVRQANTDVAAALVAFKERLIDEGAKA